MATEARTQGLTPELASVLELARWAPSGDNTQPWRFRLISADEIEVLYRPSAALGVFNLDHFAGYLAMGGLLESIDIAASLHGWKTEISTEGAVGDRFRVKFERAGRQPSALAPFLEARATQRRPLSPRRLSAAHKRALEASVGASYDLEWIETGAAKARLAWLLAAVDKVRLTIPEAYAVHRDTVAWGARFSEDRIPDAAIAVDPVLLRVMRWAMQSWSRVRFLNRYLWGHGLPRLEMDFLPAVFCGAHCLVVSKTPMSGVEDAVAGGRAMQRLWLTAASLGLQAQPEMAPLIFSRYTERATAFTEIAERRADMVALSEGLADFFGATNWTRAAFLLRFGHGKAAKARSLRKPLADLLISDA